jgi:BirA family biotin operon repressor/biotin-[acetyl-CoA-carboxylase] ligase
MIDQHELASWERALQGVLLGGPGGPDRVIVVAETSSTQDEARTRGPRIGDVVVAGRQTRGRGRFGRTWADTGEDGIAMTFVVSPERAERLAIAAGIAVAAAIESPSSGAGVRIMIKWPNDVLANGKKVAGVLVECVDNCALIGIGVNVSQTQWPAELADLAISLAQAGANIERRPLMIDIVLQMQVTLGMSDAWLEREFRKRDALLGKDALFRAASREVRGRVLRIDPLRGLAVQTGEGEIWLPAAMTTVLKD